MATSTKQEEPQISDALEIIEEERHREHTWQVHSKSRGLVELTVRLEHPHIRSYFGHGENPIVEGKIHINPGRYTYGGVQIKPDVAQALSVVLIKAHEICKTQRVELVEKADDKLKEYELQEKKRVESEAKRTELLAQRDTLVKEWREKFVEALKWYEGQPGRLKRPRKRSWDVFHELGVVSEHRITWHWSGNRYSDVPENVDKIEIRFDSERSYTPLEELPKYPRNEVDKLQIQINELRYY